jgi:hypothetical protein
MRSTLVRSIVFSDDESTGTRLHFTLFIAELKGFKGRLFFIVLQAGMDKHAKQKDKKKREAEGRARTSLGRIISEQIQTEVAFLR